MTISAISTAIGGLQNAALGFERAAGRIANAGTSGAASAEKTAAPGDGSAPQPLSILAQPLETSDITQSVLDAKEAELLYKSSLKVLEVADDLFDATLDILS